MENIKIIDLKNAEDKAKNLLEDVGEKLGMVPNIMRAMANPPVVLEGYLTLVPHYQEGHYLPNCVGR